MQKSEIDELIVRLVSESQGMYVRNRVRLDDGYSDEFSVSVSVHPVAQFTHHSYLATTSLFRNSKPLAILCGCTVWFVLGLVANSKDMFCGDVALLL